MVSYLEKIYVSIVIPAYNCETTIKTAVESVLNQTYPYYELIIVEDGSTDETFAQLKLLESRDNRIRVIKNARNSGVSFSRNCGVESAKHEWIAFLDSDDFWCNEKLEKQIKTVQASRADIVYTGYGFINPEGKTLKKIFQVPEKVTYNELLKQNIISCSGVMVKKELLQKYRMEKDSLHEDYLEWLKLLREGAKAVGINEPLHYIRIFEKETKSGNKMKSAVMNYLTYRELGISVLTSFYFMGHYMIRSIKKYGAVKYGKQ